MMKITIHDTTKTPKPHYLFIPGDRYPPSLVVAGEGSDGRLRLPRGGSGPDPGGGPNDPGCSDHTRSPTTTGFTLSGPPHPTSGQAIALSR